MFRCCLICFTKSLIQLYHHFGGCSLWCCFDGIVLYLQVSSYPIYCISEARLNHTDESRIPYKNLVEYIARLYTPTALVLNIGVLNCQLSIGYIYTHQKSYILADVSDRL